jgi:hypothetical protein
VCGEPELYSKLVSELSLYKKGVSGRSHGSSFPAPDVFLGFDSVLTRR